MTFLIKNFIPNSNLIYKTLNFRVIKGKLKSSLPSKREKAKLNIISKELNGIFLNKEFEKDIIRLTKKVNLSPADQWKNVVIAYLLIEFFVPLSYFLKLGAEKDIPRKELFKMEPGLNFSPKVIINKKTN